MALIILVEDITAFLKKDMFKYMPPYYISLFLSHRNFDIKYVSMIILLKSSAELVSKYLVDIS